MGDTKTLLRKVTSRIFNGVKSWLIGLSPLDDFEEIIYKQLNCILLENNGEQGKLVLKTTVIEKN